MKGLVRKYYLFDGESRIGGGVYLWKSRADAEAVYTAAMAGLYRRALRRAAGHPLLRDGGRGRQREGQDSGGQRRSVAAWLRKRCHPERSEGPFLSP